MLLAEHGHPAVPTSVESGLFGLMRRHHESFFHTLEVELVHQCRWATQAEARHALFRYTEGYYNRHRMHSALGYLTPKQAEQRRTG